MGKYHNKNLPTVDPAGRRFTSYNRMCKSYGKKPSDVHRLITSGTSLAEALGYEPEEEKLVLIEKPIAPITVVTSSDKPKRRGKTKPITAPNGVTYQSKRKMCEAYGVCYSTFNTRVNRGMSIEEALNINSNKFIDHKGNEYDTLKEMCNAYGIEVYTYNNRYIRGGWTLQETLEGRDEMKIAEMRSSASRSIPIKGPDGVMYKSERALCRAYEINYTTFLSRMNRGLSIEEALNNKECKERQYKYKPCTDHKGNSFATAEEMCKYWNIPYSRFYSRYKNSKWTLEEALTTPINSSKGSVDTKLNNRVKKIFGTVEDFKKECVKRKLSIEVARRRISDGMNSREEILAPARYGSYGKSCVDHNGKKFPSITLMCYSYGILPETYYARIKLGWSLKSALTVKDPELEEVDRVENITEANFYDSEETSVETVDETINSEPVTEAIQNEEVVEETIENEVVEEAPNVEVIPTPIPLHSNYSIIDRFLALVGFMNCMGCDIELEDVRKMLSDTSCEEYCYIKDLVE